MSTQTQLSNPEDAIRVLHVDDEQSPLKFTKSFVELSDSSIHMESVESPEAALRRLEEENFDCVVSDYQMPVLNGIELAVKIREISNIPIIIYTGRGSEEVAEKAFTVGINDYIRKEIEPSHYQVLARRIRSAVEERRAVDALIRSEERYRTLLEQLPDPVTVRIGDKRVYASKHAAEFLGYDKVSDLLIEGGSEIVAPDDWSIIVDHMERREEGEELPSMYEIKIRKADGSTVDAEVHTARIDYQGTPALLNIARDITERKRMEEELRESEVSARDARDYLEKLINHTNAPITVWDSAFKITRFNRAFERLTGYTADEIINRELGILFPETSREESLSRIKSTLNGVYCESVEIPILRKDGGVRVVLWNTANIYAENSGAITATIAQGQDITESKRMEEELRRSEEKFKGFLESGMDGVSLVVDDKLAYVNKRGAELLGYDDPSELIGMENIEIIHPSSRHVMLRRNKLRSQGDTKPARYEVEMLRKDGSTFHAEVLSSVIDYEGKPARLAFTRDITERKLYEKRMKALHRHAAELNKVRTMKKVYELTLDAMETSLDFSRGTFLVVEGENLTDVMLRGLDEDRPYSLPLDDKGLTVKAMRTGESVLVPDVSLDPDYIDVGVGINSELAVPVKIDGVAVAVLNTESTELGGYTEQDQVILEVLAEHVSFAIKRIIDETERARYRDRLEAIHGYAPEFAQSETLEEIGEKTFNAIESVLGFDLGSLGVVEGDLLRHVYIRGFEGGESFEIPLDEQGVTVTAVRTGETQLIPDVSKCEGYVIGIADGPREPKSELAVPVFVEDVPSGVINVESTRLDAFTEEDRGLLEIFAGHVGSALLRLKQMEELSVSEEKYQSLLESTMDAVVVNDEERYLYANAKAAELLGFEDPSSLVGRRFVEFFAPEFRELVVSRARERLEGGCPINRYAFTMLRVDGSPVEVEANVNVVDYQGKPAVLAVLRNITERKRMEEELRTYSMDLESRIEKRTRQLLDAERMAAAGSVAAMVGHDLRGPLQTIKNSIYFLKKSPESLGETLRVIDDAVDLANTMLQEFREQTREDPITFTTRVNLGALMTKAVEEAIIPEGVNAVVEVGDGLESVLVDASKFRRVMDNLIRNAVEAMPKGGELRVEARLNVGEVLVEVSDTGVGMPEEVMGELFKPFYTMKAGGLGLGLAYCKRAVEAHGGTITVESEVDRGTTFTVRIPMNDESDHV